MLRLLADENLDGRVWRGLLARMPDLDLVRVQDVGLYGADDPAVLAYAAREDRVLLSHDVRTMTVFAGERLATGQSMAGLVVVPQVERPGRVIEALQELIETSDPTDLRGQIVYLRT